MSAALLMLGEMVYGKMTEDSDRVQVPSGSFFVDAGGDLRPSLVPNKKSNR